MPITSSITQPTENTRLATLSHFDDAGSPAAASYKLGFPVLQNKTYHVQAIG